MSTGNFEGSDSDIEIIFEGAKTDEPSTSKYYESDNSTVVIEESNDEDYAVETEKLKKFSKKAAPKAASRNVDSDSSYTLGDDESSDDNMDGQDSHARKRSSPTCVFNDDNRTENYEKRLLELHDSKGDTEYYFFNNWKNQKSVWDLLYEHQRKGVQWLQEKFTGGVGGILADDMGLGKTIQTLAFLRSLGDTLYSDLSNEPSCPQRNLIICPSSVIQQWIDETHKWFPKSRVFVIHTVATTGNDFRSIFKQLTKTEKYPNGAIVITSYHMFVRLEKQINRINWLTAILDEGHRIKNNNTFVCQAAKKIPTPHRFVLSGTPIQNNLIELWNLVDFVYPNKLGCLKTFTAKFVDVIQAGSYVSSTPKAKEASYELAIVLQQAVKPYILRRLKEDLTKELELPEKQEKILLCNLTAEQRRLYENYINSEEVKSILEQKLKAFVGFKKLQNICNHPSFYKHDKSDLTRIDVNNSGKLVTLLKLLKAWRESSTKVLVYSQRRNMIELLDVICQKKGYTFEKITGSTTITARAKSVASFQTDPNVFIMLLTTRAGGLGLNLTAANKLIIFDPDWNPSSDNQAKERSYRIGQDRDVTIYRLITCGTIEEKIYMTQIYKEALSMKILHNTKTKETMPKNTLKDLFSLAQKGLSGCEAGIYTGNELIPRERKRKSQEEPSVSESKRGRDDEESPNPSKDERKKKQIKSSDLDQFEDKKVLKSLFEGSMLTSILDHNKKVKDEQEKMVLKAQARHYVIDAAKQLIHVTNRPTKNWEQIFLNELPDHESRSKSPAEEHNEFEKVDSFWNTIHGNIKKNKGKEELDKNVARAHDLRDLFRHCQNVADEARINKLFGVDKLEGIEAYFFRDMLQTIAKFDKKCNKWILKKKYH